MTSMDAAAVGAHSTRVRLVLDRRLVVIAVITVFGILSATPSLADPPVSQRGGYVFINVVDSAAKATASSSALRKLGSSVRLSTVATNDQRAGTWVGAAFGAQVPTALADDIADQLSGYAATIRIPVRVADFIELRAGRLAGAHEKPSLTGQTNALAPSRKLHCLRLTDATPEETAAALRSRELSPNWLLRTYVPTGDILTVPTGIPPADARVVMAYLPLTHTGEIDIHVALPSDGAYALLRWRGYPREARAQGAWDYRRFCK